MTFINFLDALLPLYICVALGTIVARISNISPSQLAHLLIFLFSPAVAFYGAYTAKLNTALIMLPFIGFTLSSVMVALGLIVAKRLFTTGDGSARLGAFSISTGNTGYFGIPAVLAIMGSESLPTVVMLSFGFTLYEYTVGYYVLQRHLQTPRDAIIRILKMPIIYGLVGGIVLNVTHVELPDAAISVLNMMRITFSVLGMMLVGVALSGIRIAHFDIKFQSFVHLGKFLVTPAIICSGVWLEAAMLDIFDIEARVIIVIISLVPLAANIAAFAAMFDIRTKTASLAVMISTCLALVFLPFAMSVLYPWVSRL